MVTRALVLGGGGPAGVAWELSILAGLADAGVDLAGADLIVGTSGGAAVALSHEVHELTVRLVHGRPHDTRGWKNVDLPPSPPSEYGRIEWPERSQRRSADAMLNTEADPRVYFAAERTFLAWLRTGITVMAFGFVVARFGLFLRLLRAQGGEQAAGTGLSPYIGAVLVVLGVIATAAAMISRDGGRRSRSAPSAIWSAATSRKPVNITGSSVWSPAAEMWITPAPIDRIAATSPTSRTASRCGSRRPTARANP